ncbi:MAG: hypothetical protein Q4D42_00440 [Eubacteriales bacterium]|nr:hypothetical protein [Eubacteriales bacterium]
MDSADLFASVLENPEAMQKIAGIASELMGNTSDDTTKQPLDVPVTAPDISNETIARLLPALSGIAQSSQNLPNPSKRQLLHALRPFLSSDTCAQIDHAEHILSMAQMAKAAAEQFLPQYSGTREV